MRATPRYAPNYIAEDSRPLGSGTYGTVFRGTLLLPAGSPGRAREPGTPVAVKHVSRSTWWVTRVQETRALACARHANVVELIDVMRNARGGMVLVMELAPLGNLRSLIDQAHRSRTPMTVDLVKDITCDVLRGIAYCHARRWAHLDLNPNNVLLFDGHLAKITDFGLADDTRRKRVSQVVTLWYRPIELMDKALENVPFSPTAVDVWSVGCILAELVGSVALFHGLNDTSVTAKVLAYRKDPARYLRTFLNSTQSPLKDDADLWSLLRRLLDCDPSQRCTADQALRHRFLAK